MAERRRRRASGTHSIDTDGLKNRVLRLPVPVARFSSLCGLGLDPALMYVVFPLHERGGGGEPRGGADDGDDGGVGGRR